VKARLAILLSIVATLALALLLAPGTAFAQSGRISISPAASPPPLPPGQQFYCLGGDPQASCPQGDTGQQDQQQPGQQDQQQGGDTSQLAQ
jgi:hypothetical protein